LCYAGSMIAKNRVTHLGYAAIANGEERLVQPPKVLRKIPVRLSATAGALYFGTSLALLNSGGVAKEHVLPLLGIAAALAAFIYQTATLVAGRKYRRRLQRHARQGTVVFMPLPLVLQAHELYQQQDSGVQLDVFDRDLSKTKELVDAFASDGFSDDVKQQLQQIISSA